MFFTEVHPLAVPVDAARDRLHGHPRLASALQGVSAAAFADGLGSIASLTAARDAPAITALTLGPYRRGGTSIVALRWLGAAPGSAADDDLARILDANLQLGPDGDRAARLSLLGTYQPDTVLLTDAAQDEQRVALQKSIRSMLERTAMLLMPPLPA